MLLLVLPPCSAQTVWNGLVSYWAFDDGTGSTLTEAVGGTNGTLVNFPGSPWTVGKIGGALTFDGSLAGGASWSLENSPIPKPSTYAALAGLAALGFALLWRKCAPRE